MEKIKDLENVLLRKYIGKDIWIKLKQRNRKSFQNKEC